MYVPRHLHFYAAQREGQTKQSSLPLLSCFDLSIIQLQLFNQINPDMNFDFMLGAVGAPKKASGADFHNFGTDEAFIKRMAALECPPPTAIHQRSYQTQKRSYPVARVARHCTECRKTNLFDIYLLDKSITANSHEKINVPLSKVDKGGVKFPDEENNNSSSKNSVKEEMCIQQLLLEIREFLILVNVASHEMAAMNSFRYPIQRIHRFQSKDVIDLFWIQFIKNGEKQNILTFNPAWSAENLFWIFTS
uniref:Uncharacterized protein n=1 Tax=Romanomermis culicivorax TaxID=13658 RepID=A0A915KUM4_ROMCU